MLNINFEFKHDIVTFYHAECSYSIYVNDDNRQLELKTMRAGFINLFPFNSFEILGEQETLYDSSLVGFKFNGAFGGYVKLSNLLLSDCKKILNACADLSEIVEDLKNL